MLISNSSFVYCVVATHVKALCKKRTTLEDRIASDAKCFQIIQTAR